MRLQGDYKRSLDYAYLLTYHHPDHWEGFTIAAQNFIALTNYNEAMQKIQEGLERFPEQPHLLEAAVHVSRAYGDHEKSLNYARLLVKFYPEKWHGYLLIAQDFAALKKFDSALQQYQAGLAKFPIQLELLVNAIYFFRNHSDQTKVLKYAERLITYYPHIWEGYFFAALELFESERLEDSLNKLHHGLHKFPNNFHLLHLAIITYDSSGDHERALEFSELLISSYPDKCEGYIHSIHEAIVLQELGKAYSIGENAILKLKERKHFLSILSDISVALGNEKSYLYYESMLIEESLDLGIQKELKITPQSIKSQLKNEYNLAMPPQTDQKRGKPDLYVVAGFSGCGKSTFLNTALFSIDKIFSPKKTSLDILPIKTIEYFHARRDCGTQQIKPCFFAMPFRI